MLNLSRAKAALLLAMSLTVMPPAFAQKWEQTGEASYYGSQSQGRKTASSEVYSASLLTAAHRHLPFGTRVEVTCIETGKRVVVRINDRGPFHGGRVIDLSQLAAKQLGMLKKGVMRVKLRVL